MTHEDYFQQYVAIREKEAKAFNETMRNRIDKEFHWVADYPYVTADLSNCDGHLEAKVMSVKYPITPHSGILIMPDEDHEYYEAGYTDLLFGLHIKKNNQVAHWKKLTYDDRDGIIRYMEQMLTVCKANKFNK